MAVSPTCPELWGTGEVRFDSTVGRHLVPDSDGNAEINRVCRPALAGEFSRVLAPFDAPTSSTHWKSMAGVQHIACANSEGDSLVWGISFEDL